MDNYLKAPIENRSIVQDHRTGKEYIVVAGFGFAGGRWSFRCWPVDSENEEDCINIEQGNLTVIKSN